MQETSALYRRLIADDNHWFETTIVVGESGELITERGETILFGGTAIMVAKSGADYGFLESQIFDVQTSSAMFDTEPDVGQAIAQEVDVTMINPSGDIPDMAMVILYTRVCTATEKSEWIQQGVFYIDTRQISNNESGFTTLTFHGYDAMLMTEQDYARSSLTWPAVDTAIVQEIATKIGVRVDSRTWDIMTSGYTYPLPTGYTLREMLKFISAAYAGVFIITEIGELRLVSLLELPEETNLLVDNVGDYIVFADTRIKV